jgi:hypothetical protein
MLNPAPDHARKTGALKTKRFTTEVTFLHWRLCVKWHCPICVSIERMPESGSRVQGWLGILVLNQIVA